MSLCIETDAPGTGAVFPDLSENEFYISKDSIDKRDLDNGNPFPQFIRIGKHLYNRPDQIKSRTAVSEHTFFTCKKTAKQIFVKIINQDVVVCESHGQTEIKGVERLKMELGKCSVHFAKTYTPHDDSIVAIRYYAPGSTVNDGEERIQELTYIKKPSVEGLENFDRECGEAADCLDNHLFHYTIMERAEGALDHMTADIDLKKLFDLTIEVQSCFFEKGFALKDWKLDQIVRMKDGTYKIIDLGNICSLADDKCEYGLLVPPEYFEKINWRDGSSDAKIEKQGVLWQMAVMMLQAYEQNKPGNKTNAGHEFLKSISPCNMISDKDLRDKGEGAEIAAFKGRNASQSLVETRAAYNAARGRVMRKALDERLRNALNNVPEGSIKTWIVKNVAKDPRTRNLDENASEH